MGTALAHSWFFARRDLRSLARLPAFVVITLTQPVLWLLLFGALFKRVVDIPGFTSSSYVDFFAPGVVVITALFSSGWLGMGFINDVDRGVMDRFLVSPASRGALMAGRLAYQGTVTLIQSLIIVGLALAIGADFPGGPGGVAVLVVCAMLLGAGFGSLSNGLALLVRREETLIAATQVILFPLSLLSTTFMPAQLLPSWIREFARFSPVNWAVEAGREAVAAQTDWSFVLARGGYLLAFAVVCAWLATRAFRAYQRSV